MALEYICSDFLGGQTIPQKLKSMGIEAALRLSKRRSRTPRSRSKSPKTQPELFSMVDSCPVSPKAGGTALSVSRVCAGTAIACRPAP